MRDPAPRPDDGSVDVPRLKVVYVVGSGRSGSTILCQLLGEYDGFFCGGELSDFWDRYLAENRLCACGVEFRSCKVWSRIVQKEMAGMSPAQALSVAELHMRVGRTQHLPLLLIPPLRNLIQKPLKTYVTHLETLYRAIQVETGCRVIVDSSKFPSYGWLVGRVPGIELFIVHLVRDPRAVAYSWTRTRPPGRVPTHTETPRFGPASSSLRWITRNILAEGLWRADPQHYIQLRYEDFVADPQGTVGRILEIVGERASSTPFVDTHHVRLGENHIVWGNRTRFLRDVVNIRPDSEWQTRIKPMARIIVEVMTWPWMRRYRYHSRLPIPANAILRGDPD